MKLDKTLNFKKVRCVKAYDDCLKIGKEYDVIDVSVEIKVKDDEGAFLYWESDHFEPVVDDELPKSAKNPLQGVKLTPEFEAVEPVLADNCQVNTQDNSVNIQDTPKFKVGDPVYWGLKSRIFKVYRLMTTNVLEVELDDVVTAVHKDELCPATLENYGKLCSLFERIDFEAPPKELTGSDLARAMLDKGWKYVPCYVSNTSDKNAVEVDDCGVIYTVNHNGNFQDGYGETWCHVVPFDLRTGEPLTESILND